MSSRQRNRWCRRICCWGTFGVALIPSPGEGAALASASGDPAAASSVGPAEPPPGLQKFQFGLLHVEGMDAARLHQRLSLRLPELKLATWGRQDSIESFPFLLVDVRVDPARSTRHRITLIVSDGRVFYRTVDVVAQSPEREVASALANLIMSVERRQLVADRERVVPPRSSDELDVLAGEHGRGEAIPASGEQAEGRVAVEAVAGTGEATQLGLSMGAGTLIAGPPSYGRVLSALGGEVALTLRWPEGWSAQIRARYTARRVSALRLTRLQFAAAGGYVARWPTAELSAVALVGVEPWRVEFVDDAGTVVFEDGARPGPVLVGVGVEAMAGYRYVFAGDGHMGSLVVGPRLQLSGGGAVGGDAGWTTVGIAFRDGAQLARVLRIGGAEMWVGLACRIWLGR
ncbi:MAG: hypothetical protein V3V08_07775 [Nannocystaceae bacterium]